MKIEVITGKHLLLEQELKEINDLFTKISDRLKDKRFSDYKNIEIYFRKIEGVENESACVHKAIEVVSEQSNIPFSNFMSKRRKAEYMICRRILFELMNKVLEIRVTKIAQAYFNINHATVIYHLSELENDLFLNDKKSKYIQDLRKKVCEALPEEWEAKKKLKIETL